MQGRTRVMMEGTIIAALAITLSMLPTGIGSSFSISLGQIPITIFALRRGLKPGLMAGLIWGIIHFPLGQIYFLSVPQVLIEYLLAFLFAGFAGLYAKPLQQAIAESNQGKAIRAIILGGLVGALARYFWHFVAGWVFWGSYALWGMSPVIFSLVMNGASALATGAVAIIATVTLYKMVPKLFTPTDALAITTDS
ncbi:energy-coupled thiamine transporter ThiT [Enterococcus alcedinis]|uniref:Thiamine transporter thia n=1 Tax=Enterococcus alcedinis TaxID=1274384 RepID=A0A917JII8_9ENTE|nr:energy-coupled thiamine transporter ThiT [Enterococcus alcedinis]MBP2102858.1 thiamine transporter [Enterococcus alcedinis]GGI66480.1 thiamine transporter thia [Enterococcus alcedinis]